MKIGYIHLQEHERRFKRLIFILYVNENDYIGNYLLNNKPRIPLISIIHKSHKKNFRILNPNTIINLMKSIGIV